MTPSDLTDLTLPKRLPEMKPCLKKPESLLPFALYTLCDLHDETIEAYRQLCTTGILDKNVKLPAQMKFVGQPLHSNVEYHVELAKQEAFDWQYFIVCVYAESYTVLLVTLNDDEHECKLDLVWINVDEAGSFCVNLRIANLG